MATYPTKAGTAYDDRKGSFIGQRDTNYREKIKELLIKKYGENSIEANMIIPATDMNSLSRKEVMELITATKEKGDKLSQQEILDIVGDYYNADNKVAYYDHLLDSNTKVFGFDSRGKSSKQNYQQNEDGSYSEIDASEGISNASDSGVDEYKQLIQETLMTNSASQKAQQYQEDMYSAINQYEAATNAALAGSEMEAYRAIGQQQLQLENQIADQRMRAIKSGVTSAQLASQELANIFAAQSGASQIASQVMQNKVSSANTFAQQRAAVSGDLYAMLNTNQQTAANAYAQLAATQGSYNSYIQQPWQQYAASASYYNKLGEDPYLALLGIEQNKTTK